jgi:hypothetical protein
VAGDFPSAAAQQVITNLDLQMGKANFFNFAARLLGRNDIAQSEDMSLKERFWAQLYRSKDHFRYVMSSWCDKHTGYPLVIGVDPAWYGDDRTVIFLRRGPRMFPPVICTKFDGPAIREVVFQYIETYRWGPDEKPIVLIDVNGIGASTLDAISEHVNTPPRDAKQNITFGGKVYESMRRFKILRLVAFNSSKQPTAKRFKRPGADPNEYRNARAELAFGAKAWIRDGGGFVPHPELERELVAAQYYINGTGQICIEEKAEIKKRIGASPDLADGFSIACSDDAIPPEVHIPPDLHRLVNNATRFSTLPGQGY